jgi:hypothetical protein
VWAIQNSNRKKIHVNIKIIKFYLMYFFL